MASPENLAAISGEGQRLLAFARREPDRIVPQYPSWTLRDLVAHTAAIHARTAEICSTLARERIPSPALPEGSDPFDWFEDSLESMVAGLREADADAEVWTFGSDPRLRFWERRMLIETGVHRWDAQQAIEEPDPLLEIVAVNGLDEFEDQYLARLGEVPTLTLSATDVGRSWTFGNAAPAEEVSGAASDLYLRLMSRPGSELPAVWQQAVDSLTTAAG